MRHVLFALVLTLQGAAQGKPALADWDDLKQIAPGAEVRATMADGKTFRGQFQRASQDSLALGTANSQESLDRTQVVRVQLMRTGHRWRNSLIGLGVGAGAGLGIGVGLDKHSMCTGFCVPWPNLGKALVTPIGAIVGFGTGAIMPTGGWKDVYRAP
jgi:hypothetical protein